jgi:hypothetical protein
MGILKVFGFGEQKRLSAGELGEQTNARMEVARTQIQWLKNSSPRYYYKLLEDFGLAEAAPTDLDRTKKPTGEATNYLTAKRALSRLQELQREYDNGGYSAVLKEFGLINKKDKR